MSLGGESLLRELTNHPLDVDEALIGKLSLQVAIADNNHLHTLLSSPGIAHLPSVSGPLRLPALRNGTGRPLMLTFRKLRPTRTGSVLQRFFLPFSLEPICTGLLQAPCLAALNSRPNFWRSLLRLWLPTESPAGASESLAFLSRFLSAPLQFFFLLLSCRVPAFSAGTSRFSELGLQRNKCSCHLAGVSLASVESGFCLSAPCGALITGVPHDWAVHGILIGVSS